MSMPARVHRALDALAATLPLRPLLERRLRRQFVENHNQNLFLGVYPSFAAAEQAAPKTKPLGYDNPDSALMYRDRLRRLYPTDYPVLFWLQRLLSEGVRDLFELGGHIGVSYYAYQSVLTYPDGLRWTICDVPAVMQRGQAYARHHDTVGRLRFDGDMARAERADVLLAMGVLQYLPESLGERLAALRRRPPHLLVNLTPLHPQHSYFTLQSIGTAFCPYRIDRESAFLDSLAALGYRVVDAWINPDKSCIIPFHPEHSLHHYHGYYLRLDGTG